jgi:uncharacterized membrane protein YkvA (DUF1232 family)
MIMETHKPALAGRRAVNMAEEKKNWLGPYMPQGNVLREIVQQVKLVYHLMLDPRVHPLAKLIPIAAVAYLFFPVDLIPDVIPVLGQMDDAAIVMLGMRMFFEVVPPDVVREYLKRFARPVADSEWKVMSDQPAGEPPASPAAEAAESHGEVVEGDFRVADQADQAEAAEPPAQPD